METEVKAAYDRDAFQASGKSPAIRARRVRPHPIEHITQVESVSPVVRC